MTRKIRSTCARIGISFGRVSIGRGAAGTAAVRTLGEQPLSPAIAILPRKSRRFIAPPPRYRNNIADRVARIAQRPYRQRASSRRATTSWYLFSALRVSVR